MPKSELFTGRYFFHCHTPLTDGELTLDDYLAFAAETNVERIIVLEHIRREPTYDPQRLAQDVRAASERSGMDIRLGFETKLLPDGTLDISERDFELAAVVGIAEHSFPRDAELLRSCLTNAVEHCKRRDEEKPLVWVHPGTTFRKLHADLHEDRRYHDLLRWIQKAEVRIERNLRYDLVPEDVASMLDLGDLVFAADAHSPKELDRWRSHLGPAFSPSPTTESRK